LKLQNNSLPLQLLNAFGIIYTDLPKLRSSFVQKIYPCLWFDNQAEEAANFYVSIFKNSKIENVARYGASASKASGQPEGSVMTVEFELDGQHYMALNAGPAFKFNPSISMVVNCETQDEIDHFWNELSNGGKIVECGWLTDKYGISWQIVPAVLEEMRRDNDSAKNDRVMAQVVKMKKLEIEPLQRAYDGQ
jgi:predicted 3-demethylubiquinone-9 3-methyltransferase (glyoxalase superfamily)